MIWSAWHCRVISCFSGSCLVSSVSPPIKITTDIGNLVDKEASSIGSLYRDFAAYPQPIRGQLEDRLREYARYTIEEDWPKMRKGIVPEGGTVRVNELFKVLVTFEPIKKSEVIFHTEAVEEFNNLIVLRRDRLASVSTGLPAVLWWVVTVWRAREHRFDLAAGHADPCAPDSRRCLGVYPRACDFLYRGARQSVSRQCKRWSRCDRSRL